jgi:hypothetical protein
MKADFSSCYDINYLLIFFALCRWQQQKERERSFLLINFFYFSPLN